MSMPSRNYTLSLAWLSLALASLSACLSEPEYPVEPEVKFVGLSRDTMTQGALLQDSITVVISFTDGDGDIVFPAGDTTPSVFLVNRKTREQVASFKLDPIEEKGLSNGVNGELRLRVYTTCCDYPDNINALPCEISREFPVDVLLLEAYMVDRAGNQSNSAEVAPIFLRCDRF